VGSDRDIAPLAEAADRVIDVRGHRILPGLQDSHIHAGLTWDSEMHWESIRSVNGALASVRARAAQAQPGGVDSAPVNRRMPHLRIAAAGQYDYGEGSGLTLNDPARVRAMAVGA
jgi:predicted amidohydrolase YtcJ